MDNHCYSIYCQYETIHYYLPITSFSSLAPRSIVMHPHKEFLVSCGEDRVWKLVALPKGNVLLTGLGHTDWLSNCCFHPRSVHTTPEQPNLSSNAHIYFMSLLWCLFFFLKPLYYWSMNNYVINVYSLINLEVGIHPWNHHYNLYHKHIYHLQKFLLLTLIIVIIKSLNIRPTFSKFLSTQ